jgi:hypothetical protein
LGVFFPPFLIAKSLIQHTLYITGNADATGGKQQENVMMSTELKQISFMKR